MICKCVKCKTRYEVTYKKGVEFCYTLDTLGEDATDEKIAKIAQLRIMSDLWEKQVVFCDPCGNIIAERMLPIGHNPEPATDWKKKQELINQPTKKLKGQRSFL